METNDRQRALAAGDRVRVRPDVSGGVSPGDLGTVRSVGPPDSARPVRVALDGDDPEPRGFEPTELELMEGADR
jgi:hypothetical protein